jgi:proteasome lid subunit RPN8/RPN11
VSDPGLRSGVGPTISSVAIDAILLHARDAAPEECCGLLVGQAASVVEAFATRNLAESPSRFRIDPKDHIDGLRRARRRGLDVIGFYHSHPRSSAAPSETDVAEASYPNHLCLIVGLGSDPPEVRLFQYDGRNFLEEPFVTTR